MSLATSECIDNNFIAFNITPPTLVCSANGSIFISDDRTLFSCGSNIFSFLGHDSKDNVVSPKQIMNLTSIQFVSCGETHIACIDTNGNLFTIGSNYDGQLGVGIDSATLQFTHIPQQVMNIPPIEYVSCGRYFTICVTNDRIAYSFGDNTAGQLGIGYSNKLQYVPQLIPDLSDIEFIRCGENHAICKTYSNEYYSWGDSRHGQLGQGNTQSLNIPTKCSNWPEDIIDFKSGFGHVLLLTSHGQVYSFGSNCDFLGNSFGKLGLNENITSIYTPTLITDIPLIKRIECGPDHSMCIDINNKLWVFGYNYYGQLGLGDIEDRYKPTLNESLHDIIDISSGGNHTFVKTINNEIYGFGMNEFSQLGIKTPKDQSNTEIIQLLKGNENIWGSNIRSKQKSARK